MIFKLIIALGLGAQFLAGIGCLDPFSAREPEPPDQSRSNFIPPTAPEIVFANLQIAIQENNVENYVRSFVDSTRSDKRFTFVPDQGVAATNPGIFASWGLEDERRYLTQLLQAIPADSSLGLSFLQQNRNEGATTAIITQSYELIARHTRQSANIPAVVRGEARFSLEKNLTGDWGIYMWEDFTNGVDPTWSELKALFQ